MLWKKLFFRNSKSSLDVAAEFLPYWWVYVGVFLALWMLFALWRTESGLAIAWAVIMTMFVGTFLVGVMVVVKSLKTGGEPDPSNYWPTTPSYIGQADEWAEDMRPDTAKADDILTYYRNNPNALDLPEQD